MLVDGDLIKSQEVAYFPLVPLTKGQKYRLDQKPGTVIKPNARGQFFSNPKEWFGLGLRIFSNRFLKNAEEVKEWPYRS